MSSLPWFDCTLLNKNNPLFQLNALTWNRSTPPSQTTAPRPHRIVNEGASALESVQYS